MAPIEFRTSGTPRSKRNPARWTMPLAALAMTLALAGCETLGTVTTIEPICKSLGANADGTTGPIKYNSRNSKSKRFAGPTLAPDLAARNLTGKNLGCWKG